MKNTFAVIQTGGKQYLVRVGDVLKIEKLSNDGNPLVEFEEVLMVASETGDQVEIGKPYLPGHKVEAKYLGDGRAKKVIGIKFKPKVRYRRKYGHRQPWTQVQITSIQ